VGGACDGGYMATGGWAGDGKVGIMEMGWLRRDTWGNDGWNKGRFVRRPRASLTVVWGFSIIFIVESAEKKNGSLYAWKVRSVPTMLSPTSYLRPMFSLSAIATVC